MLDKLNELSESHGALQRGNGMVTGVIALVLGMLCFFGVLADGTPYIGLDWFILDLLGSALIFIFIKKFFALRKDQPIVRSEWPTDVHHFIVNHMVIGFMLLATNLLVHQLFGWASGDGIRGWFGALLFWAGLLLIILVANLVPCWTHRAYREVPVLRRLRAVRHSAKHMDWMAGSRQHILEILITRTLVLAPNVHHRHHSQDQEALGKNYSAHFAFIDSLFGTAVKSTKRWPEHCGVLGDCVPNDFWKQAKFPFVWKG